MARKIMIIGNGPVGDGLDSVIDAADRVIRFNGIRNFDDAGSRTDVIAVCNTGRPAKAMLADPQWRTCQAVHDCRELWMVRDPAKFAALKPVLAVSHPELEDFCDDYTRGFADFAQSRDKRPFVIPGAVHEAADAALAPYDPAPYVVPSSGLVVMMQLLTDPDHAEDEIAIAGFSHEGWEGHPFDAERQLVDDLIARGRLIRLTAATPSAALSQGD